MATDRTDDLLISVSTDLTTVKRQLRQLTADIRNASTKLKALFKRAPCGGFEFLQPLARYPFEFIVRWRWHDGIVAARWLRRFQQQSGLPAPAELAVGLHRHVIALQHRLERLRAAIGLIDQQAQMWRLLRVD